MTKRSIALIETYDHPSRDSVEQMLRRSFPEFEVQIISAVAIMKRNWRWILPNLTYVAAEYGGRIMRGEMGLNAGYLQTSYLLRKLHGYMRTQLDDRRHLFSFQTQSMYDTSVPGVPHYVYTDHTHLSNLSSAYFNQRHLRSAPWLALERELYHNAACVFTRSTDVTLDLQVRYALPPSKVLCVYAGANVNPTLNFKSNNAHYSNRRILFVGNDWERKGGPELLAGFTEALKAYPDAHLSVVGASPKIDSANCSVLGPLALERVSEAYAEASIFCLPTRLEPFGIAFLEAMAHRLPVIGTRVGAVPDFVNDGVTGLLVDPGEPAQIARALATLLADPARCARFGQAGYAHLMSHYTWESVGARIRERIMGDLAGYRA